MEKENKSSFIALGGICLALTLVAVFVGSFIPGLELTMYAISSLFITVMVIEKGPKGGIITFIAAAILAFIIVPNKVGVIPFVVFFGYYGIAKYFIEKVKGPVGQLSLKIGLFLIVFAAGFFLFKGVFFGNISLPDYPVGILAVGGVAIFILYDYIMTLLINFYENRIRRYVIKK